MERNSAISGKRKFFFYTVLVVFPLAVCAVGYMSYAAFRTVDIYQSTKTSQRGWKGNVHVADAALGFSPVSNSSGAHVFPIGPDIPMRYDADGFRVPIKPENSANRQRPVILALGCSFTYGDAAYAKDTFPVLVGKALNGVSKNAGVCSYGLSQMALLAKKLIPIHRPDYVLVQYSKWLVNRAQNPFAPTYFGKLPTPFYYEKDQSFALSPPVFLTKTMELPVSRYRATPTGLIDALSFYWSVGLPLLIHDDFNMLKYGINRTIGVIPNPTRERDSLIRYVYQEINSVAQEYDAQVVIVVLGKNEEPVEADKQLFPADAILVNAHDALLRRLPVMNKENYRSAYAHWRGTPPRVVDSHPNEAAHQIIAETIVSGIRQAGPPE